MLGPGLRPRPRPIAICRSFCKTSLRQHHWQWIVDVLVFQTSETAEFDAETRTPSPTERARGTDWNATKVELTITVARHGHWRPLPNAVETLSQICVNANVTQTIFTRRVTDNLRMLKHGRRTQYIIMKIATFCSLYVYFRPIVLGLSVWGPVRWP